MEKIKNKAISLGAIDLKKSNKKNKKWMVNYNNKWIHFGQKGYQDFTQHNDLDRRRSYLKRSKGIKDKKGNPTYKNKNSANYWSINLLW